MPVIGGRVDHPQTAPELAFYAVFVKHGVPADAIVRRLDQRKRKVAQGALVVGEIVQRDGSTGTCRRLLADPGVDVVGDERRLEPCRSRRCWCSRQASEEREQPRPAWRYGEGLAAASGAAAQRRLNR